MNDDLDKNKKYITSNLFVYSFYKKRKFNIKLINTGFKSTLYVDKSFKLIESKIRSYRQQISKKISEYNKIDKSEYNFRWGPILDSWLYFVLSKVIYETDVLEFIKKKKYTHLFRIFESIIFFYKFMGCSKCYSRFTQI